jgi:CBS domain-containing protein
MLERGAGAVLVVDDQHRLCGIFTGRDGLRATFRLRFLT